MGLSFPVLLGLTGVVAIVAIYFLWVRKLTTKAPEQQVPAQATTTDAKS
jgi:hypothetical protein